MTVAVMVVAINVVVMTDRCGDAYCANGCDHGVMTTTVEESGYCDGSDDSCG